MYLYCVLCVVSVMSFTRVYCMLRVIVSCVQGESHLSAPSMTPCRYSYDVSRFVTTFTHLALVMIPSDHVSLACDSLHLSVPTSASFWLKSHPKIDRVCGLIRSRSNDSCQYRTHFVTLSHSLPNLSASWLEQSRLGAVYVVNICNAIHLALRSLAVCVDPDVSRSLIS